MCLRLPAWSENWYNPSGNLEKEQGMDIKCPNCGTEYKVDRNDMRGRTKCECEVCGKKFVFESASDRPQGDEGDVSLLCKADETKGDSRPRGDAARRRSIPILKIIVAAVAVVLVFAMCTAIFVFGIKMVMPGTENIAVHEMADRLRAEVSSTLDSVERRILEKTSGSRTLDDGSLADAKRTMDEIAKRLDAMEARVASAPDGNKDFVKGMEEMLKCVEDLTKRVYNLSVEQGLSKRLIDDLSAKLGDITKVQDSSTNAVAAGEEQLQEQKKDWTKVPIAELERKIKANVEEIARLKERNPACVVDNDIRSIRNTKKVMATIADWRYCKKAQITHVRDMFHCSACNGEMSLENANDRKYCCDTSRMKGFAAWLQARKAAEETSWIVNRIDELYGENIELKKLISAK